MIKITFPDGSVREYNEGVNGLQIAESISSRLAQEVLACGVNGETYDLGRPINEDANFVLYKWEDEEGKHAFWHTSAHLLAEALQELYPGIQFGIGPAIENGFYYDVDPGEATIKEGDFPAIEAKMLELVAKKEEIKRQDISKADALKMFGDRGEEYKTELISELEDGKITTYTQGAFTDLCRGPHLPNTRYIKAFKIERSAAAYWRGSEANPMLQRIYGAAFATKEDLKAYQTRLEEAAKRDHRKLGAEMDLFSFPDEIGPGLAVFHPKGAAVINAMEDYSREMHRKHHYSFVQTPHITKGGLYETSGHLQWYKDSMYPPMRLDEEKDENGNVIKQGFDYYLKPMNCPMHNLIFKSRQRSYRELPLRLFEFGTVYRYEKSGEVHGLTRVRGLTQDDSHIYCTREQMKDELKSLLTFVLGLLKDFGLDDFYLELSTKDPHKYVGSDEIWEEATNTLAEVAKESGLDLVDDPCGAAFYGPKISVQARDAIGRTWQVSTIQLDFNLPERFKLEYIAADGTHQRPVMIHRALFGSIERFFAVLLEHYAGAFPAWLAPVQVLGVPVADEFAPHLQKFIASLEEETVRCEIDLSDDRFGKKIRNASKSKAPFILIVGEEDMNNNAVSFRFRDGSQLNGVPVDEAKANILAVIKKRVQVNTADDFKAALAD